MFRRRSSCSSGRAYASEGPSVREGKGVAPHTITIIMDNITGVAGAADPPLGKRHAARADDGTPVTAAAAPAAGTGAVPQGAATRNKRPPSAGAEAVGKEPSFG